MVPLSTDPIALKTSAACAGSITTTHNIGCAGSAALAALWIKPVQQLRQIPRLDQVGVEPRGLCLRLHFGRVVCGVRDQRDAGAGCSTQAARDFEPVPYGQAVAAENWSWASRQEL